MFGGHFAPKIGGQFEQKLQLIIFSKSFGHENIRPKSIRPESIRDMYRSDSQSQTRWGGKP